MINKRPFKSNCSAVSKDLLSDGSDARCLTLSSPHESLQESQCDKFYHFIACAALALPCALLYTLRVSGHFDCQAVHLNFVHHPPCIRQRFLPLTAVACQGVPFRVFAPLRGLPRIGPMFRTGMQWWRLVRMVSSFSEGGYFQPRPLHPILKNE